MKKIYAILIALLMLASPIVLAEDTPVETAPEVVDEVLEEQDPGTTPDSFLWGIDRAMERIEMALTFGKAAKARKGLAHAKERLAEVKAMTEAKKLEHAEKAKQKHKEALEEVEENVEEAEQEDAEDNLELTDELEAELDSHDEEVEKVKAFIDLKVIGKLTEEQKAKVDSLMRELEAAGVKARVKFKAKKDKAIIKYKTVKEKTDKQVQEKLRELALVRLNRKVLKIEDLTAKAKEKGKDVSRMEDRLTQAKELVEEIKTSDAAKPLIKKTSKLLNFRKAKAEKIDEQTLPEADEEESSEPVEEPVEEPIELEE